MNFKSAFKDIIYPTLSREPRATRYRIVLTKQSRLVRAIVHVVSEEPAQPGGTDIATALDVILNRIIEMELTGVRHDCIRLVVEAATTLLDYPVTCNALDVRRRRDLPGRPSTTADQPLHIRSLDVVGGIVAFYIDQNGAHPVSAAVAALLRAT